MAAILYGFLKPQTTEAPVQNSQSPAPEVQKITDNPKKGTLKIFTGPQFRDLYNNFAYPNTARINETSPITGNPQADNKIRQIAELRGYQLRSAPVASAFQDVGSGYLLQQRAALPWLEMDAAAKKDGFSLGLTAAYRSAEEQKTIFTDRLTKAGIPINEIGSGKHDAQVSQLLRMTAIPGYSRHHTGYTVDISCENMPAVLFANSSCFKWLSDNNYKNSKLHGWIPSYPEGAGNQGPDPEAWEYVWVGKEAVTE